MSRSIGGRSLTTLSPIRISPDVMASSPATMRSVVVLPHPDGPTKTMNSLSRICRFTSFTACTSPYFLFALRMTTCDMKSTLYRAGQAGHVVLDEERIRNGDRNRAEQ